MSKHRPLTCRPEQNYWYNYAINIDSKAPLTAKKETVINSPIERVWRIQSDINNWPKWQKEITFACIEGALEKGTVFRWKAMGMNITSMLQEVVVNKRIGWSGKSFGMYAVHIWKFEKQADKTKVITEESLSGWFPKLIKLFKPGFLDESLSKALQTLKNHAEKIIS